MTPIAPIDLRSDTVTRPTEAMRKAMAEAAVGDDQYGEDPTTNELQRRVATLLEKEAALWLPSGTMANQIALRVLTRPGDEVVIAREAHIGWHETGGAAANAGVQLVEVGRRGTFDAADLRQAVKSRSLPVYAPTSMVAVENTHNRAGGVVWPRDMVYEVCSSAQALELRSYLDGARLWNAAIASGRPEADLAAPFDLVSVAFSKGLGAPGGSMLAGPRDLIVRADRYRRMFGGAMRQTGILAAAALYGLEHHRSRLAEDHRHARMLAERLAATKRVRIDLDTVETNIVIFELPESGPDAPAFVTRARGRGVLLNAFAARTVRAVTHLDVSFADCEAAATILEELLDARA